MSQMGTRELWQQVYIAAIRSGQHGYLTARAIADQAVEDYIDRVNKGVL